MRNTTLNLLLIYFNIYFILSSKQELYLKIAYKLNKDDLLLCQLYKLSKKKGFQKKLLRSRIAWAILPIIISVVVFYKISNNTNVIIVLGILAIIIFLVDPFFTKILYKRHYAKYIEEIYDEKAEVEENIKIENDFLILTSSDSESEGKLKISEIIEIIEIKANYFIMIGKYSSIVLPKNEKANEFVNILINQYNIQHKLEIDWKW
jgi:hypothetical protein